MKNKSLGMSLMEVLLALTLMTSLIIGISSYLWDQTRSQQDVIVAQYHNLITQAAQNYIQDNYTTIQAGSFPTAVTISQLISGGYLSSGMSSTNALGQTVCVKIIQPTSTTLSALVMGTGATTTYGRAAHIAALVGVLGGAVDATGAVNGAGGAWSIGSASSASYGTCSSGTLAIGQFVSMLYFSNGSLVSDFLHRSYVGNLTANTMNVPLGLSTQTSGASCTSSYVGFLARDTTGNILSCINNSGAYAWTATGGSWKSPVSTYTNLPSASSNSVGDVRVTTDTGRGFEWNGTAWQALSLDQNGNLTVPGTLSVTGNIAASGTISTTSTVTGAQIIPSTVVTTGAACTTTGAIAKTSTGQTVSCTSGYWAVSQVGLGIGQSWTNVTASRAYSSTYTNSTGSPIEVKVVGATCFTCGTYNLILYVNGLPVDHGYYPLESTLGNGMYLQVSAVVPNGSTYYISSNTGLVTWYELR